jgi:hypothetical protein
MEWGNSGMMGISPADWLRLARCAPFVVTPQGVAAGVERAQPPSVAPNWVCFAQFAIPHFSLETSNFTLETFPNWLCFSAHPLSSNSS